MLTRAALLATIVGRGIAPAIPGLAVGIAPFITLSGRVAAFLSQLVAAGGVAAAIRLAGAALRLPKLDLGLSLGRFARQRDRDRPGDGGLGAAAGARAVSNDGIRRHRSLVVGRAGQPTRERNARQRSGTRRCWPVGARASLHAGAFGSRSRTPR